MVRGTGAAGLAHEIFLKLLKAKREVPVRRRGRRPWPGALRGCGLMAGLRAGPRGAGATGLCGQRTNSAGAVRRLSQREDAERERAAHQPGEPVAPGHGAVRPKLQAAFPLVFEAQACKLLQAQRAGQRPLPPAYPVPGGRR